ncbi:MAG: hypothetical protein K6F96_05395 [Bacteroidales bacterium]|nr:hypothetical protein [Bacteroidales bacterium]
MKFSERYGYVKPVEVLKRGFLDAEGVSALCNCFDHLDMWFNQYDTNLGNHYDESYTELEEAIWCFFLNQRRKDFYTGRGHLVVATRYLQDDKKEWYTKFDLIEFSIRVLRKHAGKDTDYKCIVDTFVMMLNSTFKRLDYAYRVVNNQIVEITDQEEIAAIEETVRQDSSIKTHLSEALNLMSNRQTPDYRNSIKESISAVEALCREITDENTLGDALKALEKKGVKIPTFLKSGFEKLYLFTNDKRTGIRHSLMEDTESPSFDEAKFMLVACSAFVNYVQSKRSAIV